MPVLTGAQAEQIRLAREQGGGYIVYPGSGNYMKVAGTPAKEEAPPAGDDLVELEIVRNEGPGTIKVTKTVTPQRAEEIKSEIQNQEIRRAVSLGVEYAASGGPDVVRTEFGIKEEERIRREERAQAEQFIASRPDYQFVYGTKKIITGESAAAGLSVLAAIPRGGGAQELGDWKAYFKESQIEEAKLLMKGRNDVVFKQTFVEVAPVLATATLGAGLASVRIGASGSKLLTATGIGVTGIGAAYTAMEIPKLTEPGVSRVGAGLLITGAGIALTAGGLKAMRATKTREEYGEVLAVRREEIIPKGTINKYAGDAYLTKSQTTKGFAAELEGEIAPKNIFSEGRLVASRGAVEMWELKGNYFMVSREVSGKAISGKGLIDVQRTTKEALGKFSGVDVFTRETVSRPISFGEEGGGFKVSVGKGSGPTGTGGLKPLVFTGDTAATARVAVTSEIKPVITTSITPPTAGGLGSGLESADMRAFQYTPVSLKTSSRSKLKLGEAQSALIAPVSIQTRDEQFASLRNISIFSSLPSSLTSTTPAQSIATTPRFDLVTPQQQITGGGFEIKKTPIKTTDGGGGGFFLPLLEGRKGKSSLGGKIGFKRPQKYTASLAGTFGFGKGFKMPKVEMGIRIRKVKI